MAKSSYISYGLLLVALVATTTAGAVGASSSISKTHGEAVTTDSLATSRTAFGEARSFGLLTMLLLTSLPGLLLLLLLLPIPVVPTFAAAAAAAPFFAGRSSEGNGVNGVDLWRMRSALEADSCIQRVTCEMIKSSSGLDASPTWVRRVLSGIPVSQELKSKVSSASNGLRECTRIKCDPVSTFKNMFSS